MTIQDSSPRALWPGCVTGEDAEPTRKPRADDQVELVIDEFDERGFGLARAHGHRWRVQRAALGARVRAKVLRRRRDEVECIALETFARGPRHVDAPCAHFGPCGGCSLQDIEYEAQLAGLHRLVRRALEIHAVPHQDVAIEAVIPAPSTLRYRNKMEFSFGNRRFIGEDEPEGVAADYALGLHPRNLFRKVIDIHRCSIQSAVADALLNDVRELAREHAFTPFDVVTHEGFARNVVVRVSGTTGEALVNFVTSSEDERVARFALDLAARRPELTTFVHNVNGRSGQTAVGETEHVLFGPGFIRERIAGLEFHVSANSFFQTNSVQSERLFELVRDAAQLSGGETVFDLYCGTGIIGLVLAARAQQVLGFELAPSAVLDARQSAARNGIENARFFEADIAKLLSEGRYDDGGGEPRELPRADVIVVDPPRAGLHPAIAPKLGTLGARRLVYVSCNPLSAGRDLALLVSSGWRVTRIRPIDLFPHTPHVETVFTLESTT